MKIKFAILESLLLISLVFGSKMVFALPNPASLYCHDLGYSVRGEFCYFPDGSKCSMWKFFRGNCGKEFSLCQLLGAQVLNKTTTRGTWQSSEGYCRFQDGSECSIKALLNGSCHLRIRSKLLILRKWIKNLKARRGGKLSQICWHELFFSRL